MGRSLCITILSWTLAWGESLKGPLSSFRASAILTSKGESIAIGINSLSRAERALKAFGEGKIMGHYAGWAITRVVLSSSRSHRSLRST